MSTSHLNFSCLPLLTLGCRQGGEARLPWLSKGMEIPPTQTRTLSILRPDQEDSAFLGFPAPVFFLFAHFYFFQVNILLMSKRSSEEGNHHMEPRPRKSLECRKEDKKPENSSRECISQWCLQVVSKCVILTPEGLQIKVKWTSELSGFSNKMWLETLKERGRFSWWEEAGRSRQLRCQV